METIKVNSKISDILLSFDFRSADYKFCVLRKISGELIGADELFLQNGRSCLVRSLITGDVYYVCLYHKTNGDLVRRLKILNRNKYPNIWQKFKFRFEKMYYSLLLSNFEVKQVTLSVDFQKVSLHFENGRILNISA